MSDGFGRYRLRNLVHSAVLLAGMAGIAGACSWFVWGPVGLYIALGVVVIGLVASPALPIGLLARLYNAVPLGPGNAPGLYALLEQLTARAELPRVPALFLVPSTMLNAFATGRGGQAAIFVTDGIVRALDRRELAGVLAHELSHVRHDDLWIMGLADRISRLTGSVSYFGMLLLVFNVPSEASGTAMVPWPVVALLVFAPTLMALLQLALSRAREYDADLGAAELTGDPRGLASALAKLERYQGRFWEEILLPGRRIPQPSVLRTHPPTEERVRRLLALEERPAAELARPGEVHGLSVQAAPLAPPRWHWPGVWY